MRGEDEGGKELGGCGGREREKERERLREQSSSRKKVFINLNCPHQPSPLVKSSLQVFYT